MNVDKEELENIRRIADRGLLTSLEGEDSHDLWVHILTEVERLFTRGV